MTCHAHLKAKLYAKQDDSSGIRTRVIPLVKRDVLDRIQIKRESLKSDSLLGLPCEAASEAW